MSIPPGLLSPIVSDSDLGGEFVSGRVEWLMEIPLSRVYPLRHLIVTRELQTIIETAT